MLSLVPCQHLTAFSVQNDNTGILEIIEMLKKNAIIGLLK